MGPSDQLVQLQAGLGGQYTLVREVGRGGMATVYLAEDAKHHRSVALKVLHADLAAYLGPERFRREIAVAAKLQHPHILSVYDSGETATGLLWYAMPYVDGESLRERLRRDRQLSVDDAIRITQELAGALDYAHQHGVLHRDIKPENVLLTRQGDAMLADFGIARALGPDSSVSAHDARGGTSLTATGLAVGTPQYMSPEQAAADRDLTVRSDVYSLGAVAYEMLVGEPPFTGPTPQVVLAKMLSGEAPSVRRSRPTVQVSIDAALRKALAPVPADRWATTGEFAAALADAARAGLPASARPAERRRVPVAALTLTLGFLLGLGVLFAWRERASTDATAAGSGPVRVAVLPFENLGDTADAYFADGVTDAVRSKLTAIRGLEVIASTSSGQYRHTTKSPSQIARELGVRYLLVGKVRWAKASTAGPSRVQVSPELIDASTAADKWSAPFDAPLTDVFQVQADIAGQVAQQLQVALSPAARQMLDGRPTDNLDAYDAYLRARDMARRNGSALRQIAAAYREAIRLDSTFAMAWSQLAVQYALIYSRGVPLPAVGDSAHAAAATALALAPNLPEAHVALGSYFLNVADDYAQALAADSVALALSPNNSQALRLAAITEQRMGRWEAAERHLQQVARLDPRDLGAADAIGELELWRRDYPTAQAALDKALSLQPGAVGTVETRVMVALAQGDLTGARGIVRAALARIDTTTVVSYLAMSNDLGWVLDSGEERVLLGLGPAAFGNDLGGRALVLAQQYAFRGDARHARAYADSARAAFEGALRVKPDDPQMHAVLGLALAYRGDKADAVRQGERAVALRPLLQNPYWGPYLQHQLVRIYILVGEPEKALDALEPLLKIPYWLSPGWLRIDPNFAPLRGNPRFERLIAQPSTPHGP